MHYVRRKGFRGPYVSYTYYNPGEAAAPAKRKKTWAMAVLIVVLVPGAMFGLNYQAAKLLVYQPNLTVSAQENSIQPEAQTVDDNSRASGAGLPSDDAASKGLRLQQVLANWAAANPKQQWSVVIEGLGQDTFSAKLEPDRVYKAASLFKLFLAYPLFQKYGLEQLPAIKVSAAGKSQKLSDCVDLMLRVSNNPCGEAVGKKLGWKASDAKLKEIGLANTKLSDVSGPRTTASDTALLLRQIYDGPGFSSQQKAYLLGILKGQTWRGGIPAGCQGCVVFNKTGDLGFVRHDAAVIEYANGAYSLSIFTNGASYSQIAALTGKIHAAVLSNN